MELNGEDFSDIYDTNCINSQNLGLFIISLFEVFDQSKIIHKGKRLNNYSFSMHGKEVFPLLVFKPDSISDIKILLKLAARHRVEIHIVSRGKNYGYGSAQGTKEGQVILDLSQLNKIKTLNEELGYVQIQSGVSQSQLSQYLINSKSNFQADVTGAGLDASVLGNILERGFGHTDYGNRIDSLVNLIV